MVDSSVGENDCTLGYCVLYGLTVHRVVGVIISCCGGGFLDVHKNSRANDGSHVKFGTQLVLCSARLR